MSGPPTPRPDLARVGSRRALPAAAAVALVLGAVVSAGLLGRSGPDVSPSRPNGPAMDGGAVSRAAAAVAIEATREIEAARAPHLGPPPWVSYGRTPAPSASRLRALSWQVDPYET